MRHSDTPRAASRLVRRLHMGRHSHGSNIAGYRFFASGQLLLTPASDEFVHRVTWADGIAIR